jgi:hypothetical protein
VARNQKARPNMALIDVLADSLDDEDDSFGCNVCHL